MFRVAPFINLLKGKKKQEAILKNVFFYSNDITVRGDLYIFTTSNCSLVPSFILTY